MKCYKCLHLLCAAIDMAVERRRLAQSANSFSAKAEQHVRGLAVDFVGLADAVRRLAPDASWIPEIWQGHERDGAGFWRALARLELAGF